MIEELKNLRKKILDISQKNSAIHIGGSFSCLEILHTLYKYFYSKNNIILSKGHAAISQYIILNKKKIISQKLLDKYCKKSGELGVHPHISNPGIVASTGSLGHGLAIGSGIAYLNKNKEIYVILSDGELMEGSVWEAVLLIASLKINNISVIVDYNGLQSSTFNKVTHPNLDPIDKKFKSFGWNAEYCKGHDVKEIKYKIKNKKKNKPYVLIAKTIKGYPISFMMNNPIWHYRSPDISEFKKAIKEINEK
jgi:transketolase